MCSLVQQGIRTAVTIHRSSKGRSCPSHSPCWPLHFLGPWPAPTGAQPRVQDWGTGSRDSWAGTWRCWYAYTADGYAWMEPECSYLNPVNSSLWTAVLRKTTSAGGW